MAITIVDWLVNLCPVLLSLAAPTFSSYRRNRLQRDDYAFGALLVQYYWPHCKLTILELLASGRTNS